MNHPHYLLGCSHYPEQWPRDQWLLDFQKMRDLGINVVRMGEFAWTALEPEPGKFTFDWLTDALDMAASQGIRAILGTPTASLPPWLRKLHPEVLSGNEKGPFDYGARKGHCLHSPALQLASDRIVEALARRFGQNPHIIAWQVDNEPGYPFAMYDPLSLAAFRDWLQARYGTIELLNEVWGTVFWSHRYRDFNEIEFANNRPDGAANPGYRLDYRRFFSDSFLAFIRRQTDILRTHVGDRPIFTNWPNVTWSVDIYKAAGFLDCSAWDNYTRMPGTHDHREQFTAGMNHDMCRCASPNGRFLIAEKAAQPPAHAPVEGIRLQLFHELAHGALGTLYFEWRPPLRGAEQGFKSVLNIDGSFGTSADQIRQLSTDLHTLWPLLQGARTDADIAMIYCHENSWEQGFWCGNDGYDAELARVYAGLRTLGRNVDVVPPTADLSRYRLIAAPGLQIVSDELAGKLRQFVFTGGTLLLGPESGTRDTDNSLRPSLSPGPLADLAGLMVCNTASKAAMAGNLLGGKLDQGLQGGYGVRFLGNDDLFAVATIMEAVELRTAVPIAMFAGGLMEGRPAISVNKAGDGRVVHVAFTCHDSVFHEQLFKVLGQIVGVVPLLPVPQGVEVATRTVANQVVYFLLNLTAEPKKVSLPTTMLNLLENTISDDTLSLPPLGVCVLLSPADSPAAGTKGSPTHL